MRRLLILLLLGSAAGSARAEGLAFEYTIEREQGGAIRPATFLEGFETKDGLRLKVKLGQASYLYLIMGETKARYRLAFPNLETRRANGRQANEWARIPKSTFIRIGHDPGIERMYLVVASQRIPQLEDLFASGGTVTSETLALDVRDRYHGDGSQTRDLEGDTISVKFRPRTAAPSVVVEEISLRMR